jgi:hypothetical protein
MTMDDISGTTWSKLLGVTNFYEQTQTHNKTEHLDHLDVFCSHYMYLPGINDIS